MGGEHPSWLEAAASGFFAVAGEAVVSGLERPAEARKVASMVRPMVRSGRALEERGGGQKGQDERTTEADGGELEAVAGWQLHGFG